MSKKRILISGLLLCMLLPIAQADEGMWLPYLLQLNESDMQQKGMKISAKDIYDVNHGSLKDAVVLFGGGCTGEIVSDQGLLLTNHHCGYGYIQSHSSLQHDYLTNGFWARNKNEELPNNGLSVTLLVEMKDVTAEVLNGIRNNMTENERKTIVTQNIKTIQQKATEGTHYKAVVKPIYNGNQYLLFINEVFTDIRLVGAPPSNIGKFGGDTDNWMWPRHTGDFSVFRIYCGKDGKPAPYNKDNVPYKPKKHLTISLKDTKTNDFTFVFGYPGMTQQFLTSFAVELIQNQTNPIAIDLRTQRLDIIKKYMEKDKLTRIQYSAKAAGIANGWKKWIGQNNGLQRLDVIKHKQELEQRFNQWVAENSDRQQQYGGMVEAYKAFYDQLRPIAKEVSYFMEAFYSIESIKFAWQMHGILQADSLNSQQKQQYTLRINNFFKDYNSNLDKEIFDALATAYFANAQDIPNATLDKVHKIGLTKLSNEIYSKSILLNKDKMLEIVAKGDKKALNKLKKDILFTFTIPIVEHYNTNIAPKYSNLSKQTDSLDRLWTKAMMEMQPEKTFYPDANLTLRVAYGNIKGYQPKDGMIYKHYTTIEGIMQKENPDIYDYVVEPKLKDLYKHKDYGRYANKYGELPVCFIATNHTTGGNSGSPVLNAKGELIGLNFDRCWEGTMSDIQYDVDLCRNIILDIRYCLFIIDKYANAKYLVDEMTIVQ